MNFNNLHELLRIELNRRIEHGSLTGSRIAQQAGFQQAHISNFLNGKRSLSLEGLDRVLASQNLTIEQLLPADPHTLASHAPSSHTPASRGPLSPSGRPPHVIDIAAAAQPTSDPFTSSFAPTYESAFETIPVVTPTAAMDDARIAPVSIIETIQVPASRLSDNRIRPAARYAHWQRFLAIRADSQQAAAMDPIVAPGAIAVLDRHYNTLAPYRAHQPNLYAVRFGTALVLRYLDFDEGRLILRPHTRTFPVQLIPLATHETPADYIIGRVSMLFSEL